MDSTVLSPSRRTSRRLWRRRCTTTCGRGGFGSSSCAATRATARRRCSSISSGGSASNGARRPSGCWRERRPTGGVAAEARSHARGRLFEALQAVHLRGETHVTVRELRAALVFILFGVHFCDDYHEGAVAARRPAVPAYRDPGFGPYPVPDAAAPAAPALLPYWDRAFDPQSPGRQGAVLGDLARFDPALDAHPRIDRHLVRPTRDGARRGVAGYPELNLPSARRRAYFEWLERDIESLTGDPNALELAHGRHLRRFRRLPIDDGERETACRAICDGIARLATLPPQAYRRPGVVPLRIIPRTPTETAFWIEKPAGRFHLEADLPAAPPGVDRLHRQATLVYRYADGRGEERLRLGAELFHLLLELSEGYQLGDASTDDTFAHLSIFVQRLEREDDRRLLAWNPMREDAIRHPSLRALVRRFRAEARLRGHAGVVHLSRPDHHRQQHR